ncbi:MAG: universal stress protein [Kofleriaceae bacterium]
MSKQSIQVVVAYDFSPSAEHALSRAIEVASRAPQHVLHVLTAVDPHDRPPSGGSHDNPERIQQLVVEVMKLAFAGRPGAAEVQFFVHARIGKPAQEILQLASEVGADLIFIGSHGKSGLERMVLGSISERVVREARCAVLVARPKGYPQIELLKVVPFDHARVAHREPHRYSYTDNQVIARPADWPLS